MIEWSLSIVQGRQSLSFGRGLSATCLQYEGSGALRWRKGIQIEVTCIECILPVSSFNHDIEL